MKLFPPGRLALVLGPPIAAAVLLLPAGRAEAQQDQGSITGLVTDSTGAALPGARVAASSKDTGVLTSTVTNDSGSFTLASLKIGTYGLSVSRDGFKGAEVESVELHAQSRVRADFALEVGRAETVVVTAETPLLEKETSTLAFVTREREVKELPLNTRNFQYLAVLAPGILPAQNHRDEAGGFNAHGQWATQNNFILDGIDNNSQVLGLDDRKAQVLVPSLDAVQQFSIQTSNYSAEFGRNAGAVMNVSIKSGTNEFHGTAYDFMRSDAFDSRDAFGHNDFDGDGKADPEELSQHQFGLTIGGPIQRNKTFFFASVEALRVDRTRGALVAVPTLEERQGIFDPSVQLVDPVTGQPFPDNRIPRDRWDPVAANLVNLWPEPNFKGTTRHNYTASIPITTDRLQYDARIDHNFSDRDKSFVRVSYMDFDQQEHGHFDYPAIGAETSEEVVSDDKALSVAASHTHFFSNSVVNETRFGLSRLEVENFPFSPDYPNERYGLKVPFDPTVKGLTRITFGGGDFPYRLLGEAASSPLFKVGKTYQLLNNLTVVKGKHTLKTGIDFRWISALNEGIAQTRGVFNFSDTFTGHNFGDFLLGMTNFRQLTSRQDFTLLEQDYLFYLMDDWRVSSNLTLNVGLRYELSSPMYEKENRASTLDLSVYPAQVKVITAKDGSWSDRALINTDTNNIAPRLGFAYQPSAKWTLRGAAGIFYGTTAGGLGASSRLVFNWPFFRDVTAASTSTVSAGPLKDGIADDFLGDMTRMPEGLTWRVWSPDFELPTIYQWNLSVQRQLSGSAVLTMSYVGSSSQNLARVYNINDAPIGDPATEQQRRPNPRLGVVQFREPSASSGYHGLETMLDRRFSKGVRLTLSHTWSHSIDDVQELFGAEGGIIQDTRNLDADRGNSGFDRRHRVSGSWLMEIPVGKGRRYLDRGGVLNAVLGGWQFNGLLSWQTGRYFHITLSGARKLGVTSSNWRADRVEGVDPYPDKQSTAQWVVKQAFTEPKNPDGTFRFGNMRRNSLLGPAFFNLDLGVAKTFDLWADNKLQLRIEAFNATNHPSYGLPERNLGSSDFGTISSTVSTPRQFQFGAKFIF